MKARTLTFSIDPARVPQVLEALDEQILPEYRKMPNFVGLVILQADHARRELVGISVWDGGLEDSAELLASFRQRLTALAGTAPTTATYDVLRFAARGAGAGS